jgi:hypothetical protein
MLRASKFTQMLSTTIQWSGALHLRPPPPSPKNITFARIKKKAYIAGKIDQLQVKYINKF